MVIYINDARIGASPQCVPIDIAIWRHITNYVNTLGNKGLEMLKVKSMDFDKLLMAKGAIDAEIELRAARERSRLIEALGNLKTVSAAKPATVPGERPHALKGKKLPPLYRNPKNRKETWAGRGNRPRWLVAGLKGGKKLEAFAIK